MKFNLFLVIVGLLMISSVSAFEFDNIILIIDYDTKKEYNPIWDTYPPLEIKNAFGLGDTLFEGSLSQHDYTCGINCQSIININLSIGGALVQDISFDTLVNNEWIPLVGNNYEIEYEGTVDEIGVVCDIIGLTANLSEIYDCYKGKVGTKLGWINYKMNEVFSPGIYKIKISMEKMSNQTVDWKIKNNGKWLNEWAVWGNISLGADAEVVLLFPTDLATTLTILSSFNASVNVTGGAVIVNASLWTNKSGVWELKQNQSLSGEVVEDLRAYYGFNESTGTFLPDDTGNGFNGLTINMDNSNWVPGLIDNALIFNGVDEKVNITGNPLAGIGSGNFSVNVWVNSDTLSGFHFALQLSKDIVGIGDAFIEIGTSGTNARAVAKLTSTGVIILTAGTLSTGSWHMITFTRSADNFSLYLDSVLLSSDGSSLAFDAAFDSNSTIGGPHSLASFWDGELDEFYISNQTLNQTQINDLYNGGDGNKPLLIRNKIFTFDQNVTEDIIWNVQGCDSDGECGFALLNRTLFLDDTLPVINLTHPVNNEGSNTVGGLQNLNWTVTDINLDECWYNYNGTNVTVTCSENGTFFVLEADNLNLTFYSNDTVGNENLSFTSWFYEFFEEAVSFNAFVFETATEDFILNITTLPSIISIDAVLNYNGTKFTTESNCVGSVCSIETAIDILLNPIGINSENKTFFWEITGFNATDSFTINTSTRQQNVSSIFLELCDATFTVETLNFTAFDEQTLLPVDPFRFSAEFEFWLGTGTVFKNNSFQNLSTSSEQLCIIPGIREFEINADIEYDEAVGTSYTIRNYYFQNDFIDNVSEDIGLGLLFSNESTSFILKVQDADILPLPNALVFTQRFYAGLGEFRTVQVAKTDDNGKSVGFFEVETADYRFIIKRNGEVLLVTPSQNRSQKVVGEETPFTLTFTIGDERGASWEVFEPVSELISSLLYNITSQIISFSYIDTDADFELGQLQVFSFDSSNTNILICNNTASQSSAILTCNMTGNSTGDYIAKGIIFRDGERNLVEQLVFSIENFTTEAGRLGLFLGWIVILICAFAFKFNEVAGIIMINVGMIFVNLIKLVNFGITWITAWLALSILILVVMER